MNEEILKKAKADAENGDPTLYLLISLLNEVQAIKWQLNPKLMPKKPPPSFEDIARRKILEARGGNP